MFKKIKTNFKKSLGILIIFFTINLFIATAVGFMETIIDNIYAQNGYMSSNNITFELCPQGKKVSGEDFLNTVDTYKGIVIFKSLYSSEDDIAKSIFGKGVYFKDKDFGHPPLLQGRYFEISDFKKDIPIAIVGKNLLKKTNVLKNQRYYLYEGVNYKVIGILGNPNYSTPYDNMYMINLNSGLKNVQDICMMNNISWQIDNVNGNTRKCFQDIMNKLGLEAEIPPNAKQQLNPLNTALQQNKSLLEIAATVVFTLFITIINITLFWIYNRKKEIGIKKAFGASNIKIIAEMIINYTFICLCSAVLAIIVQQYLKNKIVFLEKSSVNMTNVIVLCIASLILGTVTALIPLRQILMVEPSEIMRGR